jgi:hypothetical protein
LRITKGDRRHDEQHAGGDGARRGELLLQQQRGRHLLVVDSLPLLLLLLLLLPLSAARLPLFFARTSPLPLSLPHRRRSMFVLCRDLCVLCTVV